jgi:hypothetical protein
VIDPFEEVSAVPEIDPVQQLTIELSRSMMWDMIGPHKMRDEPIRFGQNPASTDVLEAEAKEMWERKHALVPFGWDFPLLCYIAAQTASSAIISGDPTFAEMHEEDQMKFRINNVNMGNVVAAAVVSHMLQKGLIKYGEQDVILGE